MDKQQQDLFSKTIRKDVTIGDEIGGVFSTGAFENERHLASLSITFKEVDWDLEEIQARRKVIYETLYKELEYREGISRQKAIEKFYKDIRWYTGQNGSKYPSVTSIIDFANPIKWWVDENQKRALAARGQVGDLILQKYIETGQIFEPEKIPEAIKYLGIMETERLEMTGDLYSFIVKFKVRFLRGHQTVINHEHKYGGQLDAVGFFEGDPKLTLFDLKWYNPDKKGRIRTLKQMSAYAKALPDTIEQICIIPIHGNNEQGFSKPIISDGIEEYFKMFLLDRQEFTKTFGV
jgi:hypothetical protein